MAAFSVSFVLRMAILMIMVFVIWMTISYYAETARNTAQSIRMQEVVQYLEAKVFSVLLAVQDGIEISERIRLPQLDKFYTVSLSCNNGMLTLTASTGGSAMYIANEHINCSNMDLSGQVFYGDRCIWGNRTNETHIAMQLQNRCS